MAEQMVTKADQYIALMTHLEYSPHVEYMKQLTVSLKAISFCLCACFTSLLIWRVKAWSKGQKTLLQSSC